MNSHEAFKHKRIGADPAGVNECMKHLSNLVCIIDLDAPQEVVLCDRYSERQDRVVKAVP